MEPPEAPVPLTPEAPVPLTPEEPVPLTPEEPAPLTLLLLGKVGTGKSACGNALLGRPAFRSAASAAGVSVRCQREAAAPGEDGLAEPRDEEPAALAAARRDLVVVDTPGLCDGTAGREGIFAEIRRGVLGAGPGGVSALVVVLSLATRVTDEDVEVFESLTALFGPSLLEHCTVVWTHAGALGGGSLEAFLASASPHLTNFLGKCAGGSVLLENSLPPADLAPQVARVLAGARKTRAAGCYDAAALEEAELVAAARLALRYPALGKLKMKEARRVRQAVAEKADTRAIAERAAAGEGPAPSSGCAVA